MFRQESLRDTLLLTRHQHMRAPSPRPAVPASMCILEQQYSGRKARKGSSDEVQKEELTSLGFQNKNSHPGSEKIQRERIKSESTDRKIWLTNPPALHKILYEKEIKHPNSSKQSKCLQPKIYENIC